jgi:hypothetical protein
VVRNRTASKIESSWSIPLVGTKPWVVQRVQESFKVKNVSVGPIGPIIAEATFPMVSKLDREKIKIARPEADEKAVFREGKGPGKLCRWDIDTIESRSEEHLEMYYDVSWDPESVPGVALSSDDPAVFRRG